MPATGKTALRTGFTVVMCFPGDAFQKGLFHGTGPPLLSSFKDLADGPGMMRRSRNDLVSVVCEFPFLNPQTGPFYIDGAEPGDTLAIHFISIEPSRDWAASTTVPLFGSLTSTHLTATLQDPLPEIVWMWQLDRVARLCHFEANESDFTVDLPMVPMHGTVGVAPANLEVRLCVGS